MTLVRIGIGHVLPANLAVPSLVPLVGLLVGGLDVGMVVLVESTIIAIWAFNFNSMKEQQRTVHTKCSSSPISPSFLAVPSAWPLRADVEFLGALSCSGYPGKCD